MHVRNIVVSCHDSLRRHNGGCKFFVIYKIPAQHGHPSNNFSNVSDLRRTHHADPHVYTEIDPLLYRREQRQHAPVRTASALRRV